MMKNFNLLSLLILGLTIISCGGNGTKKGSDFSIQINDKTTFMLNEELSASVVSKKDRKIDSVSWFLGRERLSSEATKDFKTTLSEIHLGNHDLMAMVHSENETDTIKKKILILNDSKPEIYNYEIVATYPHDPKAYTQGLEFYNGELYESIGEYGSSKLRKVNIETGEVLNEIKIEDRYFAEGLTVINDKLVLLTWKAGEGFIYDPQSFEKTGTFVYNQSKQGWGLCNDGEHIYKSDGTEKIWLLDPETMQEQNFIQPTDNRKVYAQFNELEWVNGKIYANTYQFPSVSIINPENGALEAVINFKGLREKTGNFEQLDKTNHVLNGIAYDPENDKLYVTGKNWDTVFEVNILKN